MKNKILIFAILGGIALSYKSTASNFSAFVSADRRTSQQEKSALYPLIASSGVPYSNLGQALRALLEINENYKRLQETHKNCHASQESHSKYLALQDSYKNRQQEIDELRLVKQEIEGLRLVVAGSGLYGDLGQVVRALVENHRDYRILQINHTKCQQFQDGHRNCQHEQKIMKSKQNLWPSSGKSC